MEHRPGGKAQASQQQRRRHEHAEPRAGGAQTELRQRRRAEPEREAVAPPAKLQQDAGASRAEKAAVPCATAERHDAPAEPKPEEFWGGGVNVGDEIAKLMAAQDDKAEPEDTA